MVQLVEISEAETVAVQNEQRQVQLDGPAPVVVEANEAKPEESDSAPIAVQAEEKDEKPEETVITPPAVPVEEKNEKAEEPVSTLPAVQVEEKDEKPEETVIAPPAVPVEEKNEKAEEPVSTLPAVQVEEKDEKPEETVIAPPAVPVEEKNEKAEELVSTPPTVQSEETDEKAEEAVTAPAAPEEKEDNPDELVSTPAQEEDKTQDSIPSTEEQAEEPESEEQPEAEQVWYIDQPMVGAPGGSIPEPESENEEVTSTDKPEVAPAADDSEQESDQEESGPAAPTSILDDFKESKIGFAMLAIHDGLRQVYDLKISKSRWSYNSWLTTRSGNSTFNSNTRGCGSTQVDGLAILKRLYNHPSDGALSKELVLETFRYNGAYVYDIEEQTSQEGDVTKQVFATADCVLTVHSFPVEDDVLFRDMTPWNNTICFGDDSHTSYFSFNNNTPYFIYNESNVNDLLAKQYEEFGRWETTREDTTDVGAFRWIWLKHGLSSF